MAAIMSATDRSYNAAELKDLLAAKDAEVTGTLASFNGISGTWQGVDPGGESAWAADWQKFKDNYDSVTSNAKSVLAHDELLPVPLTWVDATYTYQAVLRAVNRNWPNAWGPGDLSDLEARLQAAYVATNQTEPSFPIPQPTPGTDSGLDPTSWQGYVTGLGAKLGIVQNPPPGTPGTAGAPPLIPTWLKVTAGAALALWGFSNVKAIVK